MLCGFARDLQDAGTNGNPVDLTLSSRAVAEHMRALGYRTGKSSVGDHLAGRCACAHRVDTTNGVKLHAAAKNLKVLTLDIENRPNVVHTWGLFNVNIGINQIIEPAGTFGVALKWYGQEPVFYSDHHHGHQEMVERTHEAMSEADIIVGFNHVGFDIPHLNREFALLGLPLPKPSGNVDLLKVARKQFRFSSNKLDFLAQQFGLGAKTSHEGHGLWVRCLNGDKDAWELMAEYAKQDVALTEALYDRLRAYIPNHPHISMWSGEEWGCPNCGNPDVSNSRNGEAHTQVQRYRAYTCSNCGANLRTTTKLINPTKTRLAKTA